MTKLRFSIVLVGALLLLIASCSTDVELNAPYKNTAVIFALLDPDPNGDNISNSLDTQWIDIDRTFMGEGDNNVYAGILDSVEYKESDFVKKVVQKIEKGSSEPIEEYPLIEKMVQRTTGGIFPTENRVYYFLPPANGMSHEHDYRLLLQFTDGREVSATTDMIKMVGNNFWQNPRENIMINLATWNTSSGDVNYIPNAAIQFFPPENSTSYEVSLRFNYIEKKYGNPELQGTPIKIDSNWFSYSIGYQEIDPNGNIQKVEFPTESFYNALRNSLSAGGNVCRQIGTYFDPPGEDPARTTCFEVQVALCNTILKDYIASNGLNISVAQERPVYTNINNGLGIFASRSTVVLKDLPLTNPVQNGGVQLGNLYSFTRSSKLAGYAFCDPNPTSDYPCTCGN